MREQVMRPNSHVRYAHASVDLSFPTHSKISWFIILIDLVKLEFGVFFLRYIIYFFYKLVISVDF